MKRTSMLLLAAVVVLIAATASAENPVAWPAGEIKWVDNPAIPGAKIAVLWGDPKTGAYGALKKVPGGTKLALHSHTYEQKVLAVSGSIILSFESGAPKELPAGSYAFIPAGAKHVADCKAGTECVYLEQQPGASDIKFVEKK